MAAISLLPKSFSPFQTMPPSISPTQLTKLPSLNPFDLQPCCTRTSTLQVNAKKKNPWLDPFDFGDDPAREFGSLFSDGKQEEDPRPPDNPNNPYGFLKFPMGYNVEVASLGLKVI